MQHASDNPQPGSPAPKHFGSVDELAHASSLLSERLAQVSALRNDGVVSDGPECRAATLDVRAALLEVYGPSSPEYLDNKRLAIWDGPRFIGASAEHKAQCFAAGIAQTEALLIHLRSRLEAQRASAVANASPAGRNVGSGSRIFIGHGRSEQWRILATFITDRLGLDYEEFNREPAPGVTTQARLEEMLEASCFALLLMTAEDTHSDGSSHARENVIHEVGLFQGRHGFRRAIVLIEAGCAEFSNLAGLNQIRFLPNDVLSRSEEIRRVLEREGVLPAAR